MFLDFLKTIIKTDICNILISHNIVSDQRSFCSYLYCYSGMEHRDQINTAVHQITLVVLTLSLI